MTDVSEDSGTPNVLVVVFQPPQTTLRKLFGSDGDLIGVGSAAITRLLEEADIVFAPQSKRVIARGERVCEDLVQLLSQHAGQRILCAVHAADEHTTETNAGIVSMISDHCPGAELREFHRDSSDPVGSALERLYDAVNERDENKYGCAVSDLIRSCSTDWGLEAKLAVLHALLALVSNDTGGTVELEDLLVGSPDAVRSTARAFWQQPLNTLAGPRRILETDYPEFAHQTVNQVVAVVSEDRDLHSGRRLLAIRALRDALLGSD